MEAQNICSKACHLVSWENPLVSGGAFLGANFVFLTLWLMEYSALQLGINFLIVVLVGSQLYQTFFGPVLSKESSPIPDQVLPEVLEVTYTSINEAIGFFRTYSHQSYAFQLGAALLIVGSLPLSLFAWLWISTLVVFVVNALKNFIGIDLVEQTKNIKNMANQQLELATSYIPKASSVAKQD